MATASRRPAARPVRPVREPAARPKNDAYVGLLFIAFLALLTSTVLLYLDYDQYGAQKPPALKAAPPGASNVPAGPSSPPSDTPPPPAPGPGPMGDPPAGNP